MSIILDALRKAEHARQRQTAPSLAVVRTATDRNGVPLWVIILLGLLVVNAALLAVVFLWPAEPTAPATAKTPVVMENTVRQNDSVMSPETSADTPAASADQMDGNVTQTMQTQRVAALTPAAPVVPAVDTPVTRPAVQSLDEVARTAEPVPAPRVSAIPANVAARPQSPPEPAQEPVQTGGYPPSLLDLRAAGSLSLPDLHLDIHVFSPVSGERFVFVNMRKYREGDRLEEGPTIDEIRPERVVMTYVGQQFILPRE